MGRKKTHIIFVHGLSSVHDISIKDNTENQSKIVHIKRAKTKNGFINVYWNNHRSELLTGSKVCFDKGPIISISQIMPAEGFIDNADRTDIQLGDSVVYLLNFQTAIFLCSTIIGFKTETSGKYKNYILLQPNNPQMDNILRAAYGGNELWFPIMHTLF